MMQRKTWKIDGYHVLIPKTKHFTWTISDWQLAYKGWQKSSAVEQREMRAGRDRRLAFANNQCIFNSQAIINACLREWLMKQYWIARANLDNLCHDSLRRDLGSVCNI